MAKKQNKKNIIIVALLIISGVMAVGYSALSSKLVINGTSNITSNFRVLFTDIQEGTMNGAETKNKSFEETTATFQVDLKKPGSSAEYILTVENQGSLDAYLESIEGIDEANAASPTYITFKLSGITKYTRLNTGDTKTFKVIVTYDESATEIPTNSKQLTLTLNFAQVSGSIPDPEPESLGNGVEYLLANKVESTVADGGNGLVAIDNTGEITTSSSPREYRYIGPNPNNYVYFNTYSSDEWTLIGIMDGIESVIDLSKSNEECEIQKQQVIERMGGSLPEGTSLECRQTGVSGQSQLWRIIGIFDGKLKLIKDTGIGYIEWDTNNVNDWTTASLQQLLNSGDYYNATGSYASSGLTTEAKQMIDTVTWNLGGISESNDLLVQSVYNDERGINVYEGHATEWTGTVGLMYASDYGFATSGGTTTGRSACLAKELYNWDSAEDCYTNNWLYNGNDLWTLTPNAGFSNYVFYVLSSGFVYNYYAGNGTGVRPSLNLKSEIEFVTGTGSESDPYILG